MRWAMVAFIHFLYCCWVLAETKRTAISPNEMGTKKMELTENVNLGEDIRTMEPVRTMENVEARPGIHDLLIKKWQDAKDYLNLNTQINCLNGGKRTIENTCSCPMYYKGADCATKMCMNGGKLVKSHATKKDCECPSANFEGEHCEKVKCTHGALVTATNGSWHCECEYRMMTGIFCDTVDPRFIKTTLTVAAVMMIVFLTYCVCSMNLCGSKIPRTSNSNDRHVQRGRRQPDNQINRLRDVLLSEETVPPNPRTRTQQPTAGRPYAVRLDTIPTFNPHMIGGVEPENCAVEMNAIEPPPSYEQAMATARIDPPGYTPMDGLKES